MLYEKEVKERILQRTTSCCGFAQDRYTDVVFHVQLTLFAFRFIETD